MSWIPQPCKANCVIILQFAAYIVAFMMYFLPFCLVSSHSTENPGAQFQAVLFCDSMQWYGIWGLLYTKKALVLWEL
jgi:hypothetical protein